uniref:Uncharacterized protein n=1 Tax=Scleropages formosus TaxID=113540 RepID=A0A8C9TU98_SCLFO
MEESDKYLLYRGLLMPRHTHSRESLKFAEELRFQDGDVLVCTYPKSVSLWGV